MEISGNIVIKKPDTALEFTGERYTSAITGEIRHEHYHRYLYALQFCRGKVVLDIASGEGYGSALIGTVASRVIGVDIASDAVQYATAIYGDRNVTFAVGDCANIPIADASVDVVVSFETIEHIVDQEKFFCEIKRVLRRDGILVISTPNTEVYKEISTKPNPFHVKELNEADFRSILGENFANFRLFGQRSVVGSAIVPQFAQLSETDAQQSFKFNDGASGGLSVVPGIGAPTYFIALASDVTLPAVLHGLLDDRPFLMELYGLLQERSINVLQLEHQLRASEALRAEAESWKSQFDNLKVAAEAEQTTLWARIDQTQSELQEARAEARSWVTELEHTKATAQADQTTLRTQIDQTKGELQEARAEASSWKAELEHTKAIAQAEQTTLRTQIEEARALLADTQRLDHVRQNELVVKACLTRFYGSVAWRAARPIRLAGKIVRAVGRRATRLLGRLSRSGSLIWPAAVLKFQSQVLVRSGLFDEQYYILSNPDVGRADISAAVHFLLYGAAEGRKPNRLFDPLFYLQTYPDVAGAGLNPLLHYLWYGAYEGRDPDPKFDTKYYLSSYPDVSRAGINPLFHFLRFGEWEGRLGRSQSLPTSDAAPSMAESATGQGLAPAFDNATGNGRNPLHRTSANRMLHQQQAKLAYRPLISLLVPTYNTEPVYLEAAVRSVIAQAYTNWEMHLVDDGSNSAATHAALDQIAGWDTRIFVTKNEQNGGISRATNAALYQARGEYVSMLDHDDEITRDALFEVVCALNTDSSIDVVYTDQDYVTPEGAQSDHLLKPDWSPHFFRGVMFVGHLLTVRRTLAIEVGGFDPAYDFVQDFEFMLRVAERTQHIRHIPKVLYHWRRTPESVAGGGKGDAGIEKLQTAAVQSHLRRLGLKGLAAPNRDHPHRVTIEPEGRHADVSIDCFVHGHAVRSAALAAIERALVHASRRPARLVVPASWSDTASRQVLRGPCVADRADRQIDESDCLHRFLNETTAEFVLLVSAAVKVDATDWLERLLLPMQQRDVMAVCGSVLSPDGSVSHAGLVLGRDGVLRPAMRGFDPEGDGYAGSMSCAREISAAWADIVLLRRSALATHLARNQAYRSANFLIADLILRATQSGLRAICVPQVRGRRMHDAEPVVQPIDAMVFTDIWGGGALGDPYYNPNFVGERADYSRVRPDR